MRYWEASEVSSHRDSGSLIMTHHRVGTPVVCSLKLARQHYAVNTSFWILSASRIRTREPDERLRSSNPVDCRRSSKRRNRPSHRCDPTDSTPTKCDVQQDNWCQVRMVPAIRDESGKGVGNSNREKDCWCGYRHKQERRKFTRREIPKHPANNKNPNPNQVEHAARKGDLPDSLVVDPPGRPPSFSPAHDCLPLFLTGFFVEP